MHTYVHTHIHKKKVLVYTLLTHAWILKHPCVSAEIYLYLSVSGRNGQGPGRTSREDFSSRKREKSFFRENSFFVLVRFRTIFSSLHCTSASEQCSPYRRRGYQKKTHTPPTLGAYGSSFSFLKNKNYMGINKLCTCLQAARLLAFACRPPRMARVSSACMRFIYAVTCIQCS